MDFHVASEIFETVASAATRSARFCAGSLRDGLEAPFGIFTAVPGGRLSNVTRLEVDAASASVAENLSSK